MGNKKKVLVCPLDWGLGHATRCIPLIRELHRSGAEVVIASSGRPAALLKKEFPALLHLEFPGYAISYPSGISMTLWMIFLFPKVFYHIVREHTQLGKLIHENNVDLVISDNRFGLWSKEIPSVFITHQVMIKCPPALSFMEPVLYRLNKWIIKKYDACWIPDVPGTDNLSGDLSHKYRLPSNASFIGGLSRFNADEAGGKSPMEIRSFKAEILVILSGPEPQRTLFEKKIFMQLSQTDMKAMVVRGIPENDSEEKISENVRSVSHLPAEEMKAAILASNLVISRSGYSTVMDIAALGKRAVFIPTPGQTEQEYLADHFKKAALFYSETQRDFDLVRCMKESQRYPGLGIRSEAKLLPAAVKKVLSD